MALANISNLYSGGAQVFDTRSHINFQARLLAQERAKQDALDAYYRRLPLTINEKGVRDQERPDIADGVMKIKDFYIQNKDRLRKGDQETAYNYERMIREQQDLVGKSQAAGLTSTNVGKLKFSPNTAYMFQSPETIERLSAHELPLTDPNHVDFDLDEFSAPPKPYDRTTYFKNFKDLKGNENKVIVKNPDGVTQTEINTPTYDEPQKEFVLSVAADKYLHDPSFTKMVDEDLGEANESNVLNEDFKRNFGHDIQTPIDLATAYTFNGLKPQPITQKVSTDQLAMMKKRQQFAIDQQARGDFYARRRQRLADGFAKKRIDYKSEKDAEGQAKVLNEFINQSYDAGTNKIEGAAVDHITIDGKDYKGKFIDVLKEFKNQFAQYEGKDEKTGVDKWKYPSGIYLSEDKKTIIPVFLGEKTGTKENRYIDSKLSKPKDIQMYKVPLAKALLTKKETGSEVIDNDFTDDLQDDTPKQPAQTKPSTNKWDKYKAK